MYKNEYFLGINNFEIYGVIVPNLQAS